MLYFDLIMTLFCIKLSISIRVWQEFFFVFSMMRFSPVLQQQTKFKCHFTSRLTSGVVEGINSRIQEVKRRARGYRNIKNFITMIYLEAGGLKLAHPLEIAKSQNVYISQTSIYHKTSIYHLQDNVKCCTMHLRYFEPKKIHEKKGRC